MIRTLLLLLVSLLCLPCWGQSLEPADWPEGVRPGLLLETQDELARAVPITAAPGFQRYRVEDFPRMIAEKRNTSWWTYHINNQGSVGSCASEAGCGSIMLIRERMGLPRVVFNPYGVYGRVNGGSDRGSTLFANLDFLKTYGAFPQDVWPRSKGWRETPSAEAYREAKKYRIREFYRIPNNDWASFGSALLQGYVVWWGYSGHSVIGVDLVSETTFRYQNSWGNWGSPSPHNDRLRYGFGIAKKEQILWGYGAWAGIEVVQEVEPGQPRHSSSIQETETQYVTAP